MFDNGARGTLPRADLASHAEFVGAEAVGRARDQRNVSGDAGEAHTRSKVPADQRAVLAEFPQAGGNGWGNQKQSVR